MNVVSVMVAAALAAIALGTALPIGNDATLSSYVGGGPGAPVSSDSYVGGGPG
jgi:hypothetical protein